MEAPLWPSEGPEPREGTLGPTAGWGGTQGVRAQLGRALVGEPVCSDGGLCFLSPCIGECVPKKNSCVIVAFTQLWGEERPGELGCLQKAGWGPPAPGPVGCTQPAWPLWTEAQTRRLVLAPQGQMLD